MRNTHIEIFDTTLRDGEQTPYVAFTKDNKIELARALSELGVDIIEAGFPISSVVEKDSISAISKLGLKSMICGLARAKTSDIDECVDCGVDIVHTFIPTSDIQRINTIKKTREQVLEITDSVVRYTRDKLDGCIFSPMDATRTDVDYLIEVCKVADAAGATTIDIPDTVGIMSPFEMKRLVTKVTRAVKCNVGAHCHNDFGRAVANTIAAVEAGASQVQVTVNGLGERAGNADLAQTVMAMESIYKIPTTIKKQMLYDISQRVSTLSKVPVHPLQPVVGANVFSHSSGIHTQGILNDTKSFEPGIMTPEMVGNARHLTLGKNVGRHAVKKLIEDYGVYPTDEQLNVIVSQIKIQACSGKRVTDEDMLAIAKTIMW